MTPPSQRVGLFSSDINHGVVTYLAPPIFNSAQRKAKRNVGFPDKVDFKSCKDDLSRPFRT
ncbi:MAG: hypothetical protein Q8861_06300 [Bacteroidota bacterium]|nr:hypothetical protein [Bacteroidota bacterium]